ncbi:MAG: hypothetical protein AAF081_18015, partial [Actinomycetota bacterium]
VALRSVVRRLDARSPVSAGNRRRRPSLPSPDLRRLSTTITTVAIALVLGVAALWLSNSDTPPAATISPAATAASATTTISSASTASTPPTSPSAAATPSATVADDPIAAPVEIAADAPVLDHAGRRYAVGGAGDIVTLGDWTCDGVETPAVLRPSTGEIAVFTDWPAPDEQVGPAVVATIEGADGFVADDTECPDLRVRTARGSRLIDLPER